MVKTNKKVVSDLDQKFEKIILKDNHLSNTIISKNKKLLRSKSSHKKDYLNNENLTQKNYLKLQSFFKNQEKVYEITNFKQSFGLLTKLFHVRKFWVRILIATFVGLLLSFNSLFFIQSTGLYTAGLAGIFQGLARITRFEITDPYLGNLMFYLIFYGLYFLVNIPLCFFGYYKIGKKFAILSFVTLLVSNLVPISINLIPGATEWFTNGFQIFGNVQPIDPNGHILTFEDSIDIIKFPSFVLYGCIAGFISGLSYAVILIISGSTGGVDFISFYYSIRKNKSIGPIVFYFNLASVIISIIVGSFIPAGMANGFSYQDFFSQNLVVSLIMILMTFLTYNYLFPKDKIVSIKIYGSKIFETVKYLNEKKFTHSMTINKSIGGYSGQDNFNLEIVCQYLELPQLLSDIRKVDTDALAIITTVKGIDGRMNFENSIRY